MGYGIKNILLLMAVFLVLCPFKAWGMEEDLREKAKDYYEQPPQNYPIKEKYVRHDLYTVPCPDQNSYFRVQFDVNDNLYFFCGSSILIYDKTGKLARRLDWKPPPGWTEKGLHKINTIFVDEIGNILVLDGDRIYVLNRDKGLVQTGWNDKGSSLWPGYYSLSNGVFYSLHMPVAKRIVCNCVHLGAGGVVTINGGVTIMTECFTLDAGATITGIGKGYTGSPLGNGVGPGLGGAQSAPISITCGTCGPGYVLFGGGGGHGGAGGTLCDTAPYCASGGAANDNPVNPTLMGSIGGDYSDNGTVYNSSNSSSGGGLLKVIVYDPVANQVAPATVNGTIDMSGLGGGADYGSDQYSGGGAGGTVFIEASTLSGTGLVQANGGAGQSTISGGGGGGIISFLENSTSFPGTVSVAGGAPGGSSGSLTFTAAPATGY